MGLFDRFVQRAGPRPSGAHSHRAQLVYLEGVARLDVLWRQSHAAADAPLLEPAAAAAAALHIDPAAGLSALLSELLLAGAFSSGSAPSSGELR